MPSCKTWARKPWARKPGARGLSTGTLYGALKWLLDQAWIERVDNGARNGASDEPGRPRKPDHLTRAGRRMLEAEAGRVERAVRAAPARSRAPRPRPAQLTGTPNSKIYILPAGHSQPRRRLAQQPGRVHDI